jgi:transcriptional regulator with XRE-family HTH domain
MAETGEPIVTLKLARKMRLLTVRGLATVSGISAPTVHQIETGKRLPRFGTIKALSDALGVEPDQVVEFRKVLLGEEK